ncbi:glycosyltransferase [Sphingobacterium sp. N143]|uniref:glycosyltransferase n=1 Tax=Sphingobacterium sp. N143 TaxID=2746727 RepID=UPI002577F4CB|nr:glycosyltransferase [Sphingobacterium sp. N143]MDM1295934.1 glycosyltransferase [Sphingobacterium sp. N143]
MSNKVVFFVTNLDSGGLENYLLRFLRKYACAFEHIIVFCKGGRGGVLERYFEEFQNVDVVKKHIGNFHLHHYINLRFWLKQYKEYTVCDFTGNFSAPVLKVARDIGVKNRIAFYRSSSNRFRETFWRLQINNYYNKLVSKNATHILANSKFAFDFFFSKTILDSRFRVIYNGLDVCSFLGVKDDLREELKISQETFVIGHTGRFNPAKNHQLIIDVARVLIYKFPNVKFILCGKGVKDNLEHRVSELGLYDNILLFENREDISKFLNTCDAYCFPSVTEGQPNSLIEAWSKGIPFVASDIPPIREITPLDFKDYLISPTDVDGFVDRLTGIIHGGFNMERRNALSNWAGQAFDAEKRFEDFYLMLIS